MNEIDQKRAQVKKQLEERNIRFDTKTVKIKGVNLLGDVDVLEMPEEKFRELAGQGLA